MKKALVFAGGGSKGAYQIGVWKALNELGESFDIATGTSIGSINAGFYVQHDFDEAEKMWRNLNAGDIMSNGINLEKSFEAMFSQREQLLPFLKTYISSKGADVSPFHRTLEELFSPEKFFGSDIDFALMTVKFPSFEPVTVTKQMMRQSEKPWQWIAASAACFPVFPVMEIDSQGYVDGGYYDNMPVSAAFDLGADDVTVIALKPEAQHRLFASHPDVRMIRPSRDLGTFLNFEKEALDFSIHLGYTDTMKVFGKYRGTVYTFIPDDKDVLYLEKISADFVKLYTAAEIACGVGDSFKFQRANRTEGVSVFLADYSKKCDPSKEELFIAAAEQYMRITGWSPDEDYSLGDVIYRIKMQVDGLYPMLEFDRETAFEKVKQFFDENCAEKKNELKKNDDDRLLILLTAFIRAVQHI